MNPVITLVLFSTGDLLIFLKNLYLYSQLHLLTERHVQCRQPLHKKQRGKRAIWIHTFQFWRTLFILIFSEWFIKGNKISYRNTYTLLLFLTTVVYHSVSSQNITLKRFLTVDAEGQKCWPAAGLSGPQFPCLYTVKRGLERSLEYLPESWCLWTFLKPHLLIKFTCIYISEQDPFHKRFARPWEVLNSPEIFTRLVMKIKTLQKLS